MEHLRVVADFVVAYNVYLLAVATMFGATFLRGFQNKNVAGGHKKLAAVVGYMMAVSDMLTIGLVVKGGITVAFVGAGGAAIGWVLGMVVHDRIMRRRMAEISRAKKERKRTKREELIQRLVDERINELGLDKVS